MSFADAKRATTAFLLASLSIACGPGEARAEVDPNLYPTYLECPTSRSPALIFANDDAAGRSIQMKVTPGWIQLGVRNADEESYRHHWTETSKIDQIADPSRRQRFRRAQTQYENLLGLCQGPEPRRTAYFEMLERYRKTIRPRWLELGQPWPLVLTDQMKAGPPTQ